MYVLFSSPSTSFIAFLCMCLSNSTNCSEGPNTTHNHFPSPPGHAISDARQEAIGQRLEKGWYQEIKNLKENSLSAVAVFVK